MNNIYHFEFWLFMKRFSILYEQTQELIDLIHEYNQVEEYKEIDFGPDRRYVFFDYNNFPNKWYGNIKIETNLHFYLYNLIRENRENIESYDDYNDNKDMYEKYIEYKNIKYKKFIEKIINYIGYHELSDVNYMT